MLVCLSAGVFLCSVLCVCLFDVCVVVKFCFCLCDVLLCVCVCVCVVLCWLVAWVGVVVIV